MTNETGTSPVFAASVAGRRVEVCFLCKWIAEDIAAHGKLTGHPLDFNGHAIFPIEGKERHLALESASIDNLIV